MSDFELRRQAEEIRLANEETGRLKAELSSARAAAVDLAAQLRVMTERMRLNENKAFKLERLRRIITVADELDDNEDW